MEVLIMVVGLLVFVTFVIFLTRLHEKIFEKLGIYKLLNKLWEKIAKNI